MIEITDDESLKKENITMDKSKDEFNNFYQKVNSLKDSIENEINKLNNLYDKIYEQITKSFEIKHEKLIKQENELKEELQNKVTQTKEKLENFLSKSNGVIRICEKINKGVKILEKESEKNMIKVLSYISKMNSNKNDINFLLVTLMKNLDMNFLEEQTNIKYKEYFFNGLHFPKNINIKDIKINSAIMTWDIDDININKIDKNKIKYKIELRENIKGEKFKQIYEGSEKEFLIKNLKKNSTYEIGIYSVYEHLISQKIYKKFDSLNLVIDSNILTESKRKDEFLEKIYEWCNCSKYELIYRGTRDGPTSSIFHEKCDDKGPTICLYLNEKGNIFGGYSSISWKKDDGTCSAKDSFIFTLTNIFGIEPTKFKDKNTGKNVHHQPGYGPSFGEHKSDISVFENFLNGESYSVFPEQYNDTAGKGRSIFTGNTDSGKAEFNIKEIEVFKVNNIVTK